MGKKIWLLIQIGICLLIINGCLGLTKTPSDNRGVSGKITDSSGAPVTGITVKLFEVPADSLTSVSWLDVHQLPLDTFITTTDENGNYSFENLEPGYYSVLATFESGNDTLQYFVPRVSVTSDVVNHGTGKIKSKGKIEVHIVKSGRELSDVLCVIPDLHLSAITDSEGKCLFETPDGEFDVIFISDIYNINSINVSISSGDIKKIQNYTAEYDVDFFSLILETSDSNSSINPDTAISIGVDKKASIRAIPGAAVTFVRWNVKEGVVIFDDQFDENTNVLILENAKIEAVFRNNVTLFASAVGNGTVTPSSSVVLALGNTYNIEAVPDAGWVFESWSVVTGVANLDSKINSSTNITLFENTTLLAKFSLPKFSVMTEMSGNGTVIPDSLKIEKGNSQTIQAVPDSGYVFINWNILSGELSLADDSSAITNITVNSAGKIQAVFHEATGSISVEHEGRGATEPSGMIEIILGKAQNITATPDSGWVFSKWITTSGDVVYDDSLKSNTRVLASSNAYIRAIFNETSVNLKLTTLGQGTVDPSSETAITPDSSVVITATPAENWNFVRWVVKDGIAFIKNISESQTTVKVNSSAEIQAQFIPAPVTLSVQKVGNGTLIPASDTILGKNQQLQLTAIPDAGWQFFKWQLINGEGSIVDESNDSTLITISTDATLRGIFKVLDYGLSLEITGKGETNLDTFQLMPSETYNPIIAYPDQGWQFVNWEIVSGNGELGSENDGRTTIQISSDVSLRANFSPSYGLLTAGFSGDGDISLNDTQTVKLGTPLEIKATPGSGWSFIHWISKSGNAQFTDPFSDSTQVTILSASIIEAVFSKNTTTLDVSVLGNGSTVPANTANVEIGSSTNIIASPAPGWLFQKWVVLSGNPIVEDSTNPQTKVTLNSPSTMQAVFIDNRATLTITQEGGGSTNPSENTIIEKGISSDISATANFGWAFEKWEVVTGGAVIDESTNPNTSVTITGDATLKAIFNQGDVTLTVLSAIGGSVTPTQMQTVSPGSKVAVMATANPGAVFSHWEVLGGVSTIEDSTNSFTNVIVNSFSTVRAIFKYELIMVNSGQGTVSPSGIFYETPGADVSISAQAANGWFFEKWSIDTGAIIIGDSLGPNSTATLNSSGTVRAVFKEYPVSLKIEKIGEGTFNPTVDTFVTKGQQVPIEAFPSFGWKFKNWEILSGTPTIADVSVSYTYVTLTGNSTIRGVFEKVDTVNVTASYLGGNTTPSGLTYPVRGDTIGITATANQGWIFKHWNTQLGNAMIADSTKESTIVVVNGNETITAVFQALATLELKVSGDEGSSGGPQGTVHPSEIQTVESGTVVAITATPNAFHRFLQWNLIWGNSSIDNIQSPSTNITVQDSSIVMAQFQKISVLTTVKTGMGVVQPLIDTVDLGQSVTINALPSPGYVFWEWKIEYGQGEILDSKSANSSITLLSDSIQVKATFVLASDVLTLGITANTGGTTIPSEVVNVLRGVPFNIQAVPLTDYRFDQWRVVSGQARFGNEDNSSTTVTLTKSSVIRAEFKED